MADDGKGLLMGRRILVVEDEYMIAADLAQSLCDLGGSVVGPAGSVSDALALVASNPALDAAVLDVNLGQEKAFPVAEALQSRGVPFVFVKGYDEWVIPEAFADAPRFEKPVDTRTLARILSK